MACKSIESSGKNEIKTEINSQNSVVMFSFSFSSEIDTFIAGANRWIAIDCIVCQIFCAQNWKGFIHIASPILVSSLNR